MELCRITMKYSPFKKENPALLVLSGTDRGPAWALISRWDLSQPLQSAFKKIFKV